MCAPFGAYSTFLSKVIVGSAILHHHPSPPHLKRSPKNPTQKRIKKCKDSFYFYGLLREINKKCSEYKVKEMKKKLSVLFLLMYSTFRLYF